MSYKDGCGVCGHLCIEVFKRRAGLAIDKQLQIISNITVFTEAGLI